MEHYSAIKRNAFESVLEPTIQNEVSQKEKDQYINPYIWNLEGFSVGSVKILLWKTNTIL